MLSSIQYSILLELDKAVDLQQSSAVSYPICVTSEDNAAQSIRENFRQLQQGSFNRWNEELQGSTGWRVSSIQLYLVGGAQVESCPHEDGGLRVYNTEARYSTQRANATYWEYRQNISIDNLQNPDWRLDLHEVGHQIGLGDTYTDDQFQRPIGQPPAVMNTLLDVSDLTEDDIDAVRHVWWMLRTGSDDPCSAGYEPGQADLNIHNNRFCVPLASDDDDGGGGGDDGNKCFNRIDDSECRSWVNQGSCSDEDAAWMAYNCCAACEDDNSGGDSCANLRSKQDCRYWADQGNCSNQYATWMAENCCASCR